MVWELVATAAAGLHAGAGLQAAIGGPPNASDSQTFATFASRTRTTQLMLSTISVSACLATYFSEDRGALWLAAAAGVGISLPFNLLLMAPPTAMMAPAARLVEPPTYHARSPGRLSPAPRSFPVPTSNLGLDQAEELGGGGGGGAALDGTAFAADSGSMYEEEGGGYYGGRGGVVAGAAASPRRLLYAKSGVLVRPEALSSSYSKKYWFSAFLSITAFGCMMSILATGRDAATYSMTPF